MSMKVLIVDDEPVSALVVERTLSRWGYEVLKASDGQEALECLQREHIPFVITDWVMPRLNGLELCRRIRQLSRESYTYIILLTSKNQKVELVEGMNAGADDFITKPFHGAELEVRLRAGERILALEQSLLQGKLEIQQINEQLRKSFERQSLINQLLRSLTSSLDFEVGLRGAVIPLRELFTASRVIIRLVNHEFQHLSIVAEDCSPEVAPMGSLSFPFELSEDQEEPANGSIQVVSDFRNQLIASDQSMSPSLLDSADVKAVLCEPLIMQGLWFGDISLHQNHPRHWSEDEIQLLKTVAQQISVVAINSELHRKVQQQSVRDGLTGLFNRRYFDESLKIEFERASRYNQPLTLAIIDLDNLKKINDELGHLAGDSAIRQIGETLHKHSRRVDIATRYGGDEFAVILPQTPWSGGQAATEHWRQAISKCLVENHQLTVSIGYATFPQHAATPEELIKAADIALYQAKKEGRNRVCGALDHDLTECPAVVR